MKIKFKVLTTCIIISICIFVAYYFFDSSDNINNSSNNSYNSNHKPIDIVIPEENYNLKLLATGDALIHSGIYKKAHLGNGDYDFDPVLSEITDITSKYDINFINQETVFADAEPSNYPRLNTPTQWGDALINAGFNMFSLANNHSMDMNTDGVIDTLNYWSNQDNIYFSGMNYSEEMRSNIEIEEKNGITYAMIAYTEHTNGINVPNDKNYLVNTYSKEVAEKDIASIRDKVDVIIISIHWGDEYTASPNENQIRIANELSDLDVDIILGNHPHWIQPIEFINDTLVIYSMGNFISTQMHIANKYPYTDSVTVGAMVMMDINKTVDSNKDILIDISNITVELIYSSYNNGEYKVIPFSKMNYTYNSDYINLYEKHKNRIISLNSEIIVNPYN